MNFEVPKARHALAWDASPRLACTWWGESAEGTACDHPAMRSRAGKRRRGERTHAVALRLGIACGRVTWDSRPRLMHFVASRLGNACRRVATGNRMWSRYLGLASQANAFRRFATGECMSSRCDWESHVVAIPGTRVPG